ncbi:TPM domain-containing protein [Sphingomonas sp. LT1P40]|uniref:TPM domain-containing protein n=1 Tax=Alteristakelama amylovorans TaxID=3096166 RepID=UPI002FCA270A
MTRRFTAEEHAVVTAAVAEAERGTDSEIVTIVTDWSDHYHDVSLYYAAAVMLASLGLFAMFPGLLDAKLALFTGGWGEAERHLQLALLVVVQAVLFLAVRFGFEALPFRGVLIPAAVRGRRVRRRAVQFYKASAEKRTEARFGVLLYLSLAEHRAEIVADEAIVAKVKDDVWGEAMVALIDRIRAGDPAGGMAAAVTRIGAVLATHFPKTESDANELPDRLIEL